MGLRYAQSGSTDDTAYRALLLNYFQASQLAEFITTRATSDEVRGADDREPIAAPDLCNALSDTTTLTLRAVVERPAKGGIDQHILPADCELSQPPA
ncbi:MAG: hypothetical protein PF630_12110 [Gammaproteobacteria bacterium]|jgi:hypothetical protein|nr:hypothetical protein [Gammaproteobacteria bacterium]